MLDFLRKLFDTSDFPARWHCGNWTSGHGWLHVLSDLGVWSAYLAIPCVLVYFVARKRNLPFRSIFLLFGAFIFFCGATHLMEAVIFWWPAYRLAAVIKLATALVSWATVVALVPMVPKALALKGPEELERIVRERTAQLKEANDELLRERELFRVTLASIGDAVITTDRETVVTFLNPVAEQLTGWRNADAVGQPLQQVFRIINEDTREPADNPATRALHEGQVVGLANHTVLVAKDGSERGIDDSAAPIMNQGTIFGAVLVFRDISARRQAEAAVALAQQRKDEFLAMLAHELRNPLAPIRSALDLMQANPNDRETTTWALGMMDQQLQQITRLVDDLLDVSRITRGRIELRTQPVELAAIVTRAVETARPIIDSNQHQLAVELPSQAIWLDADLVRLAQVVSNLLNNAAKYTDRGGRITLQAEQQGNQVVLKISDTGIGIDARLLPHVFDLFTQADRAIDRSQGGLGIGLTLVRNLVTMHGGEVTAASAGIGQGSQFTIRLPVLATPPGETTTAWQPQATAALRVLVVDDNTDAAIMLQILLTKLWNHDVRVVHDGVEAIEAAQGFQPQVILLDIGLPGLDGYAVARRIRALPEFAGTLLVALTGYGQEADRRAAFDAGFDEHVIKPVSVATLETIMSRKKGDGSL